MRVIDRDLIRGGHYGQRSCEPRKQAEHMAATDPGCYVKILLANSEPSTHGTKRTWRSRLTMSAFGGKADMARTRCPLLTQSGHSVLRIVAHAKWWSVSLLFFDPHQIRGTPHKLSLMGVLAERRPCHRNPRSRTVLVKSLLYSEIKLTNSPVCE